MRAPKCTLCGKEHWSREPCARNTVLPAMSVTRNSPSYVPPTVTELEVRVTLLEKQMEQLAQTMSAMYAPAAKASQMRKRKAHAPPGDTIVKDDESRVVGGGGYRASSQPGEASKAARDRAAYMREYRAARKRIKGAL